MTGGTAIVSGVTLPLAIRGAPAASTGNAVEASTWGAVEGLDRAHRVLIQRNGRRY